MADKAEIARNLRLIVNNGREIEDNIIICTVVSVDGVTCVCQPIDTGQAEITGVRLVSESNTTNFLITPSVDSIVGVLAFSDLETTDYMVVLFSEIDTINIRGDQYGGLVKVQELVDKINALESDLNDIKQAFTTWVPVPNDGGAALKAAAATWSGAVFVETVVGDIENENVTHG